MGDRLLAINGQALLGLSREDVVLLLKHAHDQVSLQIEYDVCRKGEMKPLRKNRNSKPDMNEMNFPLFISDPISTRNGTWIVDIEKPAPTVSLGLILGMVLKKKVQMTGRGGGTI